MRRFRRFFRRIRRRTYRSRRRMAPSKPGHKPGTGRMRKFQPVDQAGVQYSSRTLHEFFLTMIPKNTSLNDLFYTRTRDIVKIHSVIIRMTVRNKAVFPQWFHWAILTPKHDSEVTTGNFFRSQGNTTTTGGDTRAVDFDDSLPGHKMHSMSINADKYKIITHKKFLLRGDDTTGAFNNGTGYRYRQINQFIPINRQFRYDSSEGVVGSITPMNLVFWSTGLEDVSGTPATADLLCLSGDVTVNFTNTNY